MVVLLEFIPRGATLGRTANQKNQLICFDSLIDGIEVFLQIHVHHIAI